MRSASQFMTTRDKFLSIYENVGSMIDVDPAAEVRFAFGHENFFPSNHHVDSVEDGVLMQLRVELRPPQQT